MESNVMHFISVEGWASLTELVNEFGDINELLAKLVTNGELELQILDGEAYYCLAY